jgi:L-amino acid N-acyltransferase YncA
MKIRKATKKDIERINEIGLEGLFQEHTFQNPKNKKKIRQGVKEDFEFHKKTIKNNLKDKKQYWIVVEEKGIIVGFGSAYIKKDKGVIESVYIDKKFQKKSYGIKIMRHLIKWLKSKKVKHIESNFLFDNAPSLKLHKKLGFKPYFLRVRLK